MRNRIILRLRGLVVNESLLARAVTFYTDVGYTLVELPYYVRDRFAPFHHAAEQEFVIKTLSGELPHGRYLVGGQGSRLDASFDFIELYRSDIADKHAVDEMVLEISEFLRIELRANHEYRLEREDFAFKFGVDGARLKLNGVEIAQLGVRDYDGASIVCGTGLSCILLDTARNYKPETYEISH